jgi:glutamine amidotransferase
VASEPYDDDPAWVEVPDGSLLVADAGGVHVEPLG